MEETATVQSTSSRESGKGPRWRRAGASAGWLLPPVLCLCLALAVYRHTIGDLGQRLPGGADGILYAWYLAWVRHCVVQLHNPFFTAAINAPTGVNVMWNTSLLGLGLVALPLVMALGPLTATAVLFVVAPMLSATSAYLVLRRLTGVGAGAAIGGLLFGYGPFFVGHFGHLNLIFAPLLPLLLWWGYRVLFATPSAPKRDGLRLGGSDGRTGTRLGGVRSPVDHRRGRGSCGLDGHPPRAAEGAMAASGARTGYRRGRRDRGVRRAAGISVVRSAGAPAGRANGARPRRPGQLRAPQRSAGTSHAHADRRELPDTEHQWCGEHGIPRLAATARAHRRR